MVWLLITDLNQFDIQGKLATELLLLIYEQVKTSSWLHIVLDGLKADIPRSLSTYEFCHRVEKITEAQIETYLRRFATFLNLNMGTWPQGEAVRLFDKYDSELNKNPDSATQLLIDTIMQESWRVYARVASRT